MTCRFSFLLLTLWVLAPIAAAHPLHSQVTELEWNPNSRRYEVAMRLDAAGLEDALSAEVARQVRLESADFDIEVVQNYLADRFEVTQSVTKPATQLSGRILWAGLELELHSVWLYFEYEPAIEGVTLEVAAPGSRRARPTVAEVRARAGRQDRVRNECLLDVRPESVHSIQLKSAGQTLFGHCDRNTPCVIPQRRSQSGLQHVINSVIDVDLRSDTPSR